MSAESNSSHEHLTQALAGKSHPSGDYSFTNNVNGLTLHYTITGSGPLIVVQAPGWGIGAKYLQTGLEPLIQHFTLLFLLPRGTLPSSRPNDVAEMSSGAMASDLEALRLHLSLPHLTLLGHSNAGAIALSYAAQYPSRVSKLLLIDAQLVGFDDSATWMQFAGTRASDPRYADALKAFATLNPQTDEELGKGLNDILAYYFAHPEKYLAAFKEKLVDVVQVWPFRTQRVADSKDKMPEMEKIEAKTLVVVGREDAFCSVAAAERIHNAVNGSELTILEDCGHFSWVEKGDEVFEIIIRFLRD
jgi:pimeloyl-ACP methyl ester carboxylesterase